MCGAEAHDGSERPMTTRINEPRTPDASLRTSSLQPITALARSRVAAIISLAMLGLSAEAQLLHRYDFSGGANDSVGTAQGTLEGSATINGGALNTASGLNG